MKTCITCGSGLLALPVLWCPSCREFPDRWRTDAKTKTGVIEMDEDPIRVVKLKKEELGRELMKADHLVQTTQLAFLKAQQERHLLQAKYDRYNNTLSVLEDLYLSGVKL